MTYEKAKYFLHPDTTQKALRGLYRDEAIETIDEACIVACEALDKQIAKKIEHNAAKASRCTCPNCQNVVDEIVEAFGRKCRVEVSFCKFCGQKLDWSDE